MRNLVFATLLALSYQVAYAADECPDRMFYMNGQTLRGNYGYFYHPNGQTLLGNYGYLYYANGQVMKGNYDYMYYPNGQTLKGNYSYLYWPNGQTMRGNYDYWYHQNGQTLKGNYGYFYYANGQTARGNYGYLYYENGNRANDSVLVTSSSGSQAQVKFYVTSTDDELFLDFPYLEYANGVEVAAHAPSGDGNAIYPRFRIGTGQQGEFVNLWWDEEGMHCRTEYDNPNRFTMYHRAGTIEVQVNVNYEARAVRDAIQRALDNLP